MSTKNNEIVFRFPILPRRISLCRQIPDFSSLSKASSADYKEYRLEAVERHLFDLLRSLSYGYMYLILMRGIIKSSPHVRSLISHWETLRPDQIQINREVVIRVLNDPSTVPLLTVKNCDHLTTCLVRGSYSDISIFATDQDGSPLLRFVKPKSVAITSVFQDMFYIKRYCVTWHNNNGKYDIVEIMNKVKLAPGIEDILFDPFLWKQHHFQDETIVDRLSIILTGYYYKGGICGHVRRQQFKSNRKDAVDIEITTKCQNYANTYNSQELSNPENYIDQNLTFEDLYQKTQRRNRESKFKSQTLKEDSKENWYQPTLPQK